jgi:hypothetical protein
MVSVNEKGISSFELSKEEETRLYQLIKDSVKNKNELTP